MRYLAFGLLLVVTAGCTAIPDIVHQPQFHNPFPQLSRVAVLPFFNQSADPTIDQDQVALAYYNELQAVPGFEVVPVGVTKQRVLASGIPGFTDPQTPLTAEDFQALARYMDVDAVVVGSVTEFDPYYPPRMGLSVRWYAANPSYHPIPAGYGLPWGTSEEEFIPESLVFEAEFALAKEQLKTQSPPAPDEEARSIATVSRASAEELLAPTGEPVTTGQPTGPLPVEGPVGLGLVAPPQLPADWPDPRGFVPAPPSSARPPARPQHEPVLSHTRLYHGNDAEFTKRLANYFYFRDDARFGDWQAYLQRSDDFIRFCCHLHVTEMLAARGGGGKTRVVWRWPIGRYDR
ncbi:MAG: hypothetical protein HYV60_10670 [Planctomycetia bacterium]|nr:hypothetical protein [Planctomycetia bacterium]